MIPPLDLGTLLTRDPANARTSGEVATRLVQRRKTGMIGASGSCSVIVTLLLLGFFGTIARAGDSPDLDCASSTSVRHDTDEKSRLWRYGLIYVRKI